MIRILFILFCGMACRGQNTKGLFDPTKKYGSTDRETEIKTDDSKAGKKPAEEVLSPPVQISGTYLRCQATDANDEVSSDLACHIADSDNNRVLPQSLAANVEYVLPVLSDKSLQVKLIPPTELESVDMHYKFEGPSFRALKTAIQSVELQVNFRDRPGADGPAFIRGVGAQILGLPLKPWWQREVLSDTNGDGQCQAGETCRFESSELMWTRDDASIYGLLGALSLCQNLVDIYNDWRLPTEGELKIAFAKEIMALNSGLYLNLKSARYWTSSETPDAQKIAVDLENGASSHREATDALGALCVRKLYRETF